MSAASRREPALLPPGRHGPAVRRLVIPFLALSLSIMSPAVPAVAAAGGQIRVTSTAKTIADDGVCTLYEAIIAANNDVASGSTAGECAAGSGADTITFAFTNSNVDVYGGPPQITSDLTIDGGRTIALDLGGFGNVNVGQGVVALNGLDILHGSNVGVWNHAEATLTMTDSYVFGTTAGSGIYNAGTLTLQRTNLNGNTNAGNAGGGLRNDGSATILDAVIASNSAANGPGIYSTGPLVVRRSTIAVNTTAGGSGGGIYSTSTATISASTLYQNSANSGGAIFNAGDMAVDNTTIATNTAAGGAGIYNTGTLAVTNATISRNSASGLGPGMQNGGTATLRNTILAGNTGTVADLTGNALAGGSGHNQVGPLPGGVPLSSWLDPNGLLPNGSGTLTIKLVNSPINPFATGGDPAVCAVAPVGAVDQRGVARPAASCSIGAVELERKPPAVTAPIVSVSASSSLGGSAIRARVAWTGTDHAGGSGIKSYRLDRRVNGGAWTTVQNLSITSSIQTLKVGASYRFRVQALDHDGNSSTVLTGLTTTARLTQQTSSAVHYARAWSTSKSPSYSGGSTRWSKVAGASASYTATGRSYAIVATQAPTRGKARIYVNGALKATIDLGTMATTYRAQVWSIRYSKSASRTVKIVVLGTAGRPRVDLDAFIVLR